MTERTTSKRLSIKAISVESIKKFEKETSRQSYKELNSTEKLQQLVHIIADSYSQPVLIIVDEVDRLANTRGLASFMKATSGDEAKFILVGIASNIGRLLADHQSLERSLTPVLVPTMNEGELREIIEKAENYLTDQSIGITFDHFAAKEIVEIAGGYPWFVHVIGQSALLVAAEENRSLVVEPDVIKAMDLIASNQFAQQFEEMYLNAVRHSAQRELVLRTFASWLGPDIPTSVVYRVLKTRLSVRNPSAYKTQLGSGEYGRVLYTPQFSNKRWIRYSNEMFKVYVRMRRSVYRGVDTRVKRAIAAERVVEAAKNRPEGTA